MRRSGEASAGALLSRAASGDRQALVKLLKKHGPKIRDRIAAKIPRRWRSVLSSDDVMQQTYTDAFLDINRFVGKVEDSFTAWLTSLAKCNLVDAVRMLHAEKRGGARRGVVVGTYEDSCLGLYELLGATQTTPSRCAARQEACRVLEWATEQLPDLYQRVVKMYDLQGCPIDEVAEALGRSGGAVYMIRARAHRQLRKIMGTASKYFSRA